ncbi:MAG TPA: dihydrolipoamide acetyltransferase family protein [Candidatus Acidoferrum sp.]|nr:dihydrolipoamide acetyltransferase family protein [Candidatus Acidoferrum sp.]
MPNVQMPRLSDSMETGKILRWLKKEGEEVKKGEPLVEIESDKANIEVEAYASGKLSKIVVQEGESAPIGAVIAEIGGNAGPPAGASGAERAERAPEAVRAAPKAEQPAAPKAEKAAGPEAEPQTAEQKSKPAETSAPKAQATQPEAHVTRAEKAMASARKEPEAAPEAGGGEQYPQGGPDDRTEVGAAAQAALNVIRRPTASEDGERQRVSPVARRLAEEQGIDLREVQGTGPGGRITKEDVEAAAQRGQRPSAAPAAAAPPAAAPATAPAREERRPTARPTEEVEVVELSKLQATVAMRIAQSKFSAPHFYVTSEIAMDDAVRLREMFNEAVDKAEAISINDLVVKAVALALTRFPEVNASWADGRIERKRDINIGIAVGLPDRLIVPVLRNADQKSLKEIAKESKQVIERARTNRASALDYLGNTFTISNLGMYDVDQFTAIINPPDSGILAVGSILDKPVVRDGQLVPGKRMRVTLSVDHRVFYGVTAAQFLQEVKRLLQSPMALVI